MNNGIKLLYRKENKVSLSNKYNVTKGSEYRYERHTKAVLNDERNHKPMNSGKCGYDYTPLLKFLLSKIGSDWDKAPLLLFGSNSRCVYSDLFYGLNCYI